MLSRFVFLMVMVLINMLNGPVIPVQDGLSELAERLDSTNARERAKAAHLLGRESLTARSAIPALTRLLYDNTPVSRPICGEKRWRTNEGWRETSPGKEAAIALSRIGTPSVDPLIDALADEAWLARKHSALSLGLIEDRRALEPLIVRLDDDVDEVREQAAWALGMIENAGALDALTEATKDEDPDVREQAVWAIGRIYCP